MRLLLTKIYYILAASIILTAGARADWPCRSDVTVPIVTDTGSQWNVRLTSDQHEGAIFVWQDKRDGVYDKLYLQRVNASGNPLWKTGGIRLAQTEGYQYYPQIISDGAGGAFVVWQDNRSGVDYDVYVQRVDPSGQFLWNTNGTLVSNVTGQQYNPQCISDGTGGVIIVWQDRRSGTYDIYAQHLNAFGTILWAAGGVPVCTSLGDQIEPKLVTDGHGGAIVGWTDYRSTTTIADIYAQRLQGTDGSRLWNSPGVQICIAPNAQRFVQIVSDETGGAILVWQDRRDGLTDNMYAERVDAGGVIQWTINGVQAAPSSGMQYYPQAVSDHASGVVLVWQENRTGSDYDVYAQRLGPYGQRLWLSSGVAICTSTWSQLNPTLTIQGNSVIVVWQDGRNSSDYDIWSQRLSMNGQLLWAPNGIAVALAPANQVSPQIVSDSLQGGIIAWTDFRSNNGTSDIYASRVGANGMLAGGCFRSFPQDSFALRSVRYKRGLYKIIGLPNTGTVRDSTFRRGAFPSGVTLGVNRVDSSRSYGWEFFTQSIFVRNALPQTVTPRPFDHFATRRFVGALRNPTLMRYNNRLAGELLTLKMNIAASDVGITQEQLGDVVFRDSVPNPLTGKRLRAITGTVDSMLTYWSRYVGSDYVQLANTLHRINGAFEGKFDTVSIIPLRVKSVRAVLSLPFLIPSADPPTVLPKFIPEFVNDELPMGFQLGQNYPNPFNPITTIEFILPEPAVVSLKIYNLLGQQVASLIDRQMLQDGSQVMDFDATGLASGVYFYRLVAEPVNGGMISSQVKKMMLLK